MTRLTVHGRLTAAEGRRIKGWLLPFGKPGQTNLGRVVVNPGNVPVPADVSTLFASLDHLDGRDPVATFAAVEERPEGLWAEWDVPETHGGDKLLAEYRAGTRTGISVELEPVTIRDGVAAGTLIGCAFPVTPAFPDARLVAELAPDLEPAATAEPAADLEGIARTLAATSGVEWDDLDDDARAHYLDAAAAALAAVAPPEDPAALAASQTPDAAGAVDTPPAEQDENMTQATAPAALLAGARGSAAPAAPAAPSRLLAADASPGEVYRLLAGIAQSGDRSRLLAALSDIVPSNTLDRDQPQWIGEVWSGNAYQRRIVPLLSQAELTALTVKGWRWVTKPVMGKYAGNKTAIPSATISTQAYTDDAQRFAGGHDIDRKYRDFRDTAFFEAYFAAMSESYAKLTDLYAIEELKVGATTTAVGAVPSGVPAGWSAVVDLALEVIDVGTPTFALIEKSVYRDMFLTGQDKFLEFLNASIGFEAGQLDSFKLIPVASAAVGTASSATGLDKGEIIVGTSAAVKFRELGGGTPIRVDALNIANGGEDAGVFGYAHVGIEDARGVRKVDLTADV